MTNTLDDKAIVKDYFNATGFDRWRRIYGDGEVNKVQKDIRIGHQQTIDTVIGWLENMTICPISQSVMLVVESVVLVFPSLKRAQLFSPVIFLRKW